MEGTVNQQHRPPPPPPPPPGTGSPRDSRALVFVADSAHPAADRQTCYSRGHRGVHLRRDQHQVDNHNLAVLADLVFAERIDRARIDNQEVDLSLVRIFEVLDGKIRHWRVYFDLATYQRAFATK